MIVDIQEIKAQIRRIVQKGKEGIALTKHAKEQMKAREVDIIDILNVLNWGEVVHDPDEKVDMKFKVKEKDLEGEPLCVVLILLNKDSLLVITVHG